MRQVDVAREQTDIARQNNWLNLITALVAGLAACFAAIAAKASRDTVDAFSEVERADIVVTLENFATFRDGQYDVGTGTVTGKERLKFDVVANNVGRSAALIVHAGSGWNDNMSSHGDVALAGAPKTYIVKPAESAKLEVLGHITLADLNRDRFFWLLIIYNSPLRGQRLVRYCFEIWGLNSNVPYMERQRTEWAGGPKKRRWWRFWQKGQEQA